MIPKPPTTLGSAGRALWRDTLERYELAPTELRVLGLACSAADDAADARAALRASGVIVTNRYGQPAAHAAVAIARQAEASISRLLATLHVVDPPIRAPRTSSTPGPKPKRGAHE